jgi:hypothetical protein
MTHELVHTALASLPDDRRWMEEGNATYIEPIARTQAGELSANHVWLGMVSGMQSWRTGAGGPRLGSNSQLGRTGDKGTAYLLRQFWGYVCCPIHLRERCPSSVHED